MTRAGAAAFGLLALAVALLGACRDPARPNYEYVPEMVESLPYDSFAPNPVTRGGRTLQPPPPGTVARGAVSFPYGPGPEEAARAGRELANPVPASPEAVARGERVFRAMCSPCHGAGGQGDGPVIPRFPAPPSLIADHARALRDGQIVHIIVRGQGLMPSHAPQVGWDDRWKLVHYLRALQRPQRGGTGS